MLEEKICVIILVLKYGPGFKDRRALIRRAVSATHLNECPFLGILQQEATNACIAGMTMAALTGSNKKQIMNLGLQSAGCAVANLAGERLGTSIVDSHLALQQASQAERLRATQSASNRAESLAEREAALPILKNVGTRLQRRSIKQIQRSPLCQNIHGLLCLKFEKYTSL